MSVSTLVQIGLVFAGFGLILALAGWGMGLLLNVAKRTDSDLHGGKLLMRAALICLLGGGFSLGIALLLLFSAGIWWCISLLLSEITPSRLALVSIAVGPAPLLISALGSGIATLVGGSVDTSAARNCTVFGIDFGPLLHSLFMAYWLVFLTGGLGVFGLIGSGIWALVRLF